MKQIIIQYFKIIGNALTGLAFAFASFYLFLNLYHYSELRRVVYVDFDNSSSIKELNNNLNEVRLNINKFNQSNYSGSLNYSEAYDLNRKFNSCLDSFNNETYLSLKDKDILDIKDVYNLLKSLDDNILNDCIVKQLYTLVTSDTNNDYLSDNKEMLKSYMDTLLQEGTYLEKDILNNSSYYFNTDIIALTVKNNIRDGFYEVIAGYNKVAKLLKVLSEWYADEVVTTLPNTSLESEVSNND